MKNIEIKYRLSQFSEVSQFLKSLPEVRLIKTIHQKDIYYHSPTGRLKLRIPSTETAELIYYEREDLSAARESNYYLFPVPNPGPLHELLKQALGETVTVEKERTLLMFRNVRIHLDRVSHLGDFLEFESVIDTDTPVEKAADNLRHIQQALAHFDMIPRSGSYADLLKEKVQ
jgi:predicted adenylyl cyclase CyaB